MNPPCQRDGSSAGAMERLDMTHPAIRLEGFKKTFGLNYAVRDRIGYLPEERGMYQKMRVVEHLTLFGQIKGMRRAAAGIDAREDPRPRDSDAGQGADPASAAALDPARLRL